MADQQLVAPDAALADLTLAASVEMPLELLDLIGMCAKGSNKVTEDYARSKFGLRVPKTGNLALPERFQYPYLKPPQLAMLPRQT